MEFSPEVNGRLKAECRSRTRTATLCAVVATLLIASAGCGKKGVEQHGAAVARARDSTSAANTAHRNNASGRRARRSSSGALASLLTQKGCVQFGAAVGQCSRRAVGHLALDLKSSVTIHAFAGWIRPVRFVVRPRPAWFRTAGPPAVFGLERPRGVSGIPTRGSGVESRRGGGRRQIEPVVPAAALPSGYEAHLYSRSSADHARHEPHVAFPATRPPSPPPAPP
jgi:hypothetical protein